jgi:cytochrome c-type biogenesis protein CcmH/NrfG
MTKRFAAAVAAAAFSVCLVSAALTTAQDAPFAPSAGAEAKDPEVEKLKAAAEKLEAELKKKPKDEKLKLKTAEAVYQAGHKMMLSPKLPPRLKYRGALKFFRRTLQLDPKHKKAAEEKKTIEDIYQQMGMPIPK